MDADIPMSQAHPRLSRATTSISVASSGSRRHWQGGSILGRRQQPAIWASYHDAPRATLYRILFLLRTFWRLLDRHAAIAPVRGVADLNDLHGALQLRDGVDRTYTHGFLRLVNDARATLGLPRLFWPMKEDRLGQADLPNRQHVARIYQFAKKQAFRAIDRIELALLVGSDPAPTASEVWHLFLLFVLRSGWNRQTAMDLDITTGVLPHPTSTAHHVVRSFKARGGTEQFAIGLDKSMLSPGNIVRLLIRATVPLRQQIRHQLLDLTTASEPIEADAGRLERARLEAIGRSPWIFPVRGEARSLTTQSLRETLVEMNAALPLGQRVDESITMADLRDAYIGFAYEYSGYSWMVAKVAAGHKGLESLKSYLRQRQWKAHGERKVLRFGEALWSLVTERRIVDAAVLHAIVEKRDVSQEQVDRWLAKRDRTRMGTGCTDFHHPPGYLVPNHVAGSGCRVQRCTLCTHAVVFEDSVDLLARRQAELTALKERIPLTTWLESSFPDEADATASHLKRFDAAAVQRCLDRWSRAIATGEHRVIHFEGSYGLA